MSIWPPRLFAVAAALYPMQTVVAAAPGLGGGEDLGISLGRIVTALLICVIVAFFAILAIRQRAGKGDLPALFSRMTPGPRAVEVVETRRLSANADICLVRHDDREYLLLLLAGHGSVLRERPLPPPAGAEA